MNVTIISDLSTVLPSSITSTSLGNVRIYKPVQLFVQIVSWHGNNDYRSFFIIEGSSTYYMWLCEEDLAWLHCFSPHIHLLGHNTADVILPCEVSMAASSSVSPLLIEAVPRGPFSFHFGHFIVDTLPLLLMCRDIEAYSKTSYRLLSIASHSWQHELVLIGTGNCQRYLQTIDFKKGLVSHYDRYSVSTFRLTASFIDLKAKHRSSFFSRFYSRSQSSTIMSRAQTNATRKVAVISRNERNIRNRRLNNETDFNGLFLDIYYELLLPSSYGPANLYARILHSQFSAVLGVHGSALFQFFLYGMCNMPIVMLTNSLSLEYPWCGQMADFLPFKGRFWFLSKTSSLHSPSDWNTSSSFELSPVTEIVSLISSGAHVNSTLLSSCNSYTAVHSGTLN